MRGKSKGTIFPASRIKRLMQTNEEVGKIAVPTPVLISKALQLMLEDFLRNCAETAREHNSSTVTPKLMDICIKNLERFSFLSKTMKEKAEMFYEEERVRSVEDGEQSIRDRDITQGKPEEWTGLEEKKRKQRSHVRNASFNKKTKKCPFKESHSDMLSLDTTSKGSLIPLSLPSLDGRGYENDYDEEASNTSSNSFEQLKTETTVLVESTNRESNVGFYNIDEEKESEGPAEMSCYHTEKPLIGATWEKNEQVALLAHAKSPTSSLLAISNLSTASEKVSSPTHVCTDTVRSVIQITDIIHSTNVTL